MFTDCVLFCAGKKQKKLKLIGFVHFGASTHVKVSLFSFLLNVCFFSFVFLGQELQMSTGKGVGRFLEFSDSPEKSYIMQFPNEQVRLKVYDWCE